MKRLLAIFAVSMLAADWPEFRGPHGQGHYDGPPLPTTWDAAAGKNVAWKRAVPGLGWSSPAVVGGRVYLTTATPGTVSQPEQSLRALCLDAATGETVWDVEVFQQPRTAPRVQAKNSHASASPLVRGDKVYVHFGHQGTACLNASDGKAVWAKRDLPYPPVHGNGGSPALVDGRLIFSCDGGDGPFVAARDAATGAVTWKTPRSWDHFKKFAFSTPLAIQVGGSTQIVIPGAGGVAAYDPKTGAELWHVPHEGYSVVPRPVFGHGLLYFSSGYDTAEFFALRVDRKGASVAWSLKRGAPHNPSPLLVGNELFLCADNGLASCVDAKTGKVHWQERIPGAYSASPVAAGGHVYFVNESGLTTVVKAATKFGKVAANALAERTLASPAAADGALYLRAEKHLYRIANK